MKTPNFSVKHLLFPSFVACIMFFMLAPNVLAQSESSGEQLSKTLIESEKPTETWNQFSDNEKSTIKNFAEPAKDKIQELKKKDLNNTEFKNEIQKLPEELQIAIHASLMPVDKQRTDDPKTFTTFASYNTSHILTYNGIWDNTVAKFTHNIIWDSNGSSVTDGDTTIIPSAPGLGWSYDGLITNDRDLSSSGYNSNVQGSFSYDAADVNIQNWYPRSQIIGYPDGDYFYTDYS